MKKSILLSFTIILLVFLIACTSNSATQEPMRDEDKVATIVAGTLSAIPTITSLPTETLTPEVTPTPSVQCTGYLTRIILTMPNHLWNCSDFISDNGREGIEVSSQIFDIKVSYNVARGLFCEPNRQNSDCVVTPFFENNMLKLDLYKSLGENKEIFGHIQRNEGYILISIKYLNMETRDLTQIEMDELIHFIDSITFEHE